MLPSSVKFLASALLIPEPPSSLDLVIASHPPYPMHFPLLLRRAPSQMVWWSERSPRWLSFPTWLAIPHLRAAQRHHPRRSVGHLISVRHRLLRLRQVILSPWRTCSTLRESTRASLTRFLIPWSCSSSSAESSPRSVERCWSKAWCSRASNQCSNNKK